MSLAGRHNAIFTRQPPVFRRSQSAQPAATTSYTITPSVAPIEGNLMVVAFGGIQTRVVSSIPSGWVDVCSYSVGGGTWGMYAKIATSSEPASYNFAWTGGTLQGGYTFFEFTGFYGNTVEEILSGQTHLGRTGATTSKAFAAYDINEPQVVVTMRVPSGSSTWTVNNSFTQVYSGTLHSSAYRIYSVPVLGEVTTWSGASTNVQIGKTHLRGLIT